jgi:hypothetical protein
MSMTTLSWFVTFLIDINRFSLPHLQRSLMCATVEDLSQGPNSDQPCIKTPRATGTSIAGKRYHTHIHT